MNEAPKIAFVLVPGGFCPASVFDKLTTILKSRRYDAVSLDHPSVGKTDGPPASMYDDAAHVTETIARIADGGQDVILVGSSYGGIIASEAVRGLPKAERSRQGKKCGLIHLVLMASLLAPAGISINELIRGNLPDFVKTTSPVDYVDPPPAEHVDIFSDLSSREEQLQLANSMKPHSTRAFEDKISYEGYLHVPTTCIIGTRDITVSPKLQHDNIDAVIAQGHSNINKVVIEADHCSFVSQPDTVADILTRIMAESQATAQ